MQASLPRPQERTRQADTPVPWQQESNILSGYSPAIAGDIRDEIEVAYRPAMYAGYDLFTGSFASPLYGGYQEEQPQEEKS